MHKSLLLPENSYPPRSSSENCSNDTDCFPKTKELHLISVEVKEEAIPGEVHCEDVLVEQTIEFLRGTFDNLKVHEAFA